VAIAADIAADLARALDPVRLAEAASIVPDPWQAEALRSCAPRILLNCSRQSGKSTVTAILAVHTALYEPGALVLLLSPSLRQSQELFRKALGVYRALGRPVPAEAENTLAVQLENHSRILSLPGKEHTVRGYSGVRLLVSRLQALLQSERLHLPKTREAEQLAKKLLDYELKIDERANDTYGAFKVGTHDDLVTALGLAVQLPAHRPKVWILEEKVMSLQAGAFEPVAPRRS
jgi:hypothetical protein